MRSLAAARLRPQRGALGVNIRGSLNLVGALVKYLGLAPLFPLAFALGYSENVWPFVITGVAAGSFGWALERLTVGKERVGIREGFLVVSLTWLLAAAVGALPYILSGEQQIEGPVDAYFEAMSGFTTTGATVLTDVEALPNSLLMWRQLTQWLGGMGIIVLALAVLPRLRVGGRQLLEHELPGPEFEQMTARIRDTARRLWALYVALTVAMVGVLTAWAWTGIDDRMSPFEALAHALSTLPTGGFSTEARGAEAFGAASQWTITAFMVLAGANFALLYRAFVRRQPRPLVRDEEFRLYIALLALASLLVIAEIWSEGVARGEAAVRHGVFQVVSMMTTTGAVSTDFNLWPLFAAIVLVAVMLFGGSAGSTAGSVKVVRHLLIGRILRRELDQSVHPEIVSRVRLNGVPVDERILRAVSSFVLLYVGVFALGTFALVADGARVDLDLRLLDAVAATATTLGNVGPAFGFAGPLGSFDPFSDVSKVLMIVLMWVGRLEIIPVAVLLSRRYWRI
ncbi:MAG: TrkH family potassium uptake protein [Actinomycetota bacterium]|nr:TrkH family potassium uptake protein [Actinomycetota bacterium]